MVWSWGFSGRQGQLERSLTLGDLLSRLREDFDYLVNIFDGGAQTVGGVIRQPIELLEECWDIGVVWLVSHGGRNPGRG